MNALAQTTIAGLSVGALCAASFAPTEVFAQDTNGKVTATQDQRYLIYVKGIT